MGLILVLTGCGTTPGAPGPEGPAPSLPAPDESAEAEPVERLGFVDLEPLEYVTPVAQAGRRSTGTRMFYRLIPAQTDAKSAPVFVVFNGGPGGTSMYLMSFGTGPTVLDAMQPEQPATANPWSLSGLGNVLYIDARGTGFSYNLREDGVTSPESFSAASFNPDIDAADFVRVVLRVLGDQPVLRNNPVVLVGESYGGARSVLMLDLLLSRQGIQKRFGADLIDEIDAHFRLVFPDAPEGDGLPQTRAGQFGTQILIQPWILGALQTQATVRFRQSQQTDAAHSISDTRLSPEDYLVRDQALSTQMGSESGFKALMGIDPEEVPRLAGDERGDAVRCPNPCASPSNEDGLQGILGALPPDDRYFMALMPLNQQGAPNGYRETTDGAESINAFLTAARFTRTLITDAQYDAIAPGSALVAALQELPRACEGSPNPPLKSVRLGGTAFDGSGQRIIMDYGSLPGEWTAATRVIEHPAFSNSGHMVTLSEPERFYNVVREFLEQPLERSP